VNFRYNFLASFRVVMPWVIHVVAMSTIVALPVAPILSIVARYFIACSMRLVGIFALRGCRRGGCALPGRAIVFIG